MGRWGQAAKRAACGRTTPHTTRAALRLGLGVVVPLLVEALLLSRDDADELKSCQWAAVTVIMTSEPMLGQTVKKGLERIAGSLAGGAIAVGVASVSTNPWFLMACASVVLYTAFWQLTFKWGYDYTAKLLAITFCLVLWGIEDDAKTLWVAGTRLAGVVAGVALGMLLSVVLPPRSATEEAFAACRAALADLRAASTLAWRVREVSRGLGSPSDAAGAPEGEAAARGADDGPRQPLLDGQPPPFGEAEEAAVQALMAEMDVKCDSCSAALIQMTATIRIAQSEYLVGKRRGLLDRAWHPMLLGCAPLLFPAWRVPAPEFERLAQQVKRVCRILWALHLTLLNDGLDPAAMEAVRARLPGDLVPALVESAQAAVAALEEGFPARSVFVAPGAATLPRVALDSFCRCVQQFLALSELQDVRLQRRILLQAQGGAAAAEADLSGRGCLLSPRAYFEGRSGSFDASVIDSLPPMVEQAGALGPGDSDLTYVLTLRWHNLLFILDELQMDLEQLYDAMDALLAQAPVAG